jgi:hypothetical protein
MVAEKNHIFVSRTAWKQKRTIYTNRSSGRELKPGPPEQQPVVLPTLQCDGNSRSSTRKMTGSDLKFILASLFSLNRPNRDKVNCVAKA